MVAGATGIDLFLLVVDAAEGARPQTLEHLAILRLLGVEHGVVAVTKADAVDDETLELALEEARELVPGAPVVAVSATTGAGLDELRAALASVAAETASSAAPTCPTRLYVDRVVHAAGHRDGRHRDALVGVDRRGRRAARSSRRAGTSASAACRCTTGRSSGPRRASASRSTSPASSAATCGAATRSSRRARSPARYRLDVALDELEPIADGARLTVHHGTSRIPARVVRVGERHAQLRLAAPGRRRPRRPRRPARARRPSAAAVVLDPAPPRRHGRRARPAARRERPGLDRARARPRARERRAARRPCPARRGAARGGARRASGSSTAGRSPTRGSSRPRRTSRRGCAPGPRRRRSTPAWCSPSCCRRSRGRRPSSTCSRSSVAGRRSYLPGTAASLGARADAAAALERDLASAGLAATKVEDGELARYLEGEGRLVRLGDGFAVGPGAYEVARDLVVSECAAAGEITLARFRDLSGVGRRDAQLLLERIDVDGVTRRVGDRRVLRRASRADAGTH